MDSRKAIIKLLQDNPEKEYSVKDFKENGIVNISKTRICQILNSLHEKNTVTRYKRLNSTTNRHTLHYKINLSNPTYEVDKNEAWIKRAEALAKFLNLDINHLMNELLDDYAYKYLKPTEEKGENDD
jgi:predicted transcriptional regulator